MIDYKNNNLFINILLWTWCLPQTLVGLILKLVWKGRKTEYWFNNRKYIIYNTDIKNLGGVSLGKYILLGPNMDSEETIKHEFGHHIQSLYLGPLFLLIIGLPSALWCWFIQDLINKYRTKKNKPLLTYYWLYTESWANKLAELK